MFDLFLFFEIENWPRHPGMIALNAWDYSPAV
jgi:hypothetical protein